MPVHATELGQTVLSGYPIRARRDAFLYVDSFS